MHVEHPHLITSAHELDALYEAPSARAMRKVIDHLDAHCRAFIERSPFVLLATRGRDGGDCSPRGDRPGFAHVADDHTLLLPDHRGNNRLDTLRNVLHDPAVGLLFLVPGVDETLRVNGDARISVDPALRERWAVDGRLPKTVIVVEVREAFVQCSRALVRSALWDATRHVPRAALPSLGRMLADHTGGTVDAEQYDREAATLVRQTLY
jgi:PPOX class probable FMN-dependent enzyme